MILKNRCCSLSTRTIWANLLQNHGNSSLYRNKRELSATEADILGPCDAKFEYMRRLLDRLFT